jgi:hypothetical protein
MSDCLLTAIRVLHVEARLASGAASFVDADTMLPILLYALAQADVPDMHACLYCLKNFAAADYVGEKGNVMRLWVFCGVCVCVGMSVDRRTDRLGPSLVHS